MVAYLQDGGVDDDRVTAKTAEKPKPAGLPLTHEAALKWFYKDPQGEIQGEARSRVLWDPRRRSSHSTSPPLWGSCRSLQ